MEVILTQDVDRIGKAGEKVRVKNGYFRNFLSPRKLAVLATEAGLRFLEAKKKQAEEKRQKEKAGAEALAEKLKSLTCVIKAKVGEEGKLFGSVTRQHIEAELKNHEFSIDKRVIELAEPIHRVGEYQVPVRLHSDVEVLLKVVVTQN